MSQANQNPFQAPIKSTAKDSASPVSGEVLDFIVIAKKWEKYRLIYNGILVVETVLLACLLYTSPSPRDQRGSRMPSSA